MLKLLDSPGRFHNEILMIFGTGVFGGRGMFGITSLAPEKILGSPQRTFYICLGVKGIKQLIFHDG